MTLLEGQGWLWLALRLEHPGYFGNVYFDFKCIMIMPILGSGRPVTRHPGPRTGDPHHMRHQGEILTGAALPQIKTFQSNA